MATRLYLTRTAAPAGPAASTRWERCWFLYRLRLVVDKIDPSQTNFNIGDNGGAAGDHVHLGQFVSDPIPAQLVEGTLVGYRAAQANAPAAGTVYLVARVVSGDGTVERGELYYGPASGAAFPAALASVESPPAGTALTGVTAEEGDRIVVEIGGLRSATGESLYMSHVAHPSNTDFTASGQSVTNRNHWIEFSQDLWPANAPLTAELAAAAGGTGSLDVSGDTDAATANVIAAVASMGGDLDVYTPLEITATVPAVNGAGGDLVDVVSFGED